MLPPRVADVPEFIMSSVIIIALLARWAGNLKGAAAADALSLLGAFVREGLMGTTTNMWWVQVALPDVASPPALASTDSGCAPVSIIDGLLDMNEFRRALPPHMSRMVLRTSIIS